MFRGKAARWAGRTAIAALVLTAAACTSPSDRAEQSYKKGQELAAKGDLAGAAREFQAAVRFRTNFAPAWRALAETEQKRSNWAGLLPALATLVELEPSDMATRLRLAQLQVAAGAFDQALATITPAADAPSPTPEAVTVKASILLGLKDEAGALREAERARSLQADNLGAALIIATVKLDRGDAKGALADLAKGRETEADRLPVGLMRLRVLEALGDDAPLFAELRNLIQLGGEASPALRRQLVRLLIARGRDAEAEDELRKAAADPANVEASLDLARFLFTRRSPDAAQQELEARSTKAPDPLPYRLALAALEMERGRPSQAIARLETLLASNLAREARARVQLDLATIHLGQKGFPAAEAIVNDLLGRDNRNADALRLRATLRLQQGAGEAAIIDLREALNQQPRSPALLLLMGAAHEQTGAIELAERQYADAVRASQTDPGFVLQYVAFLNRRGGGARVEDVLIDATGRHPTNARLWAALGEARLQRGDWTGAQEVADTIRRLGGEGGLADQLRGLALSGQNRVNESIQTFQTALKATPGAAQPLTALIRTYLRAQRFDEAEAFLGNLLKANPQNVQALVLLGSVQLARNAPDKALATLRLAIEREPGNPVGYAALADALARRGEVEQALAVARQGLQAQPDHFGLRVLTATAYERRDEHGRAIEIFEALLAEQPGSLIIANNLASLLANHRTDKPSLDRAQQLGAMLRQANNPFFKDTLGWLAYMRADYNSAVSLLEEAAAALPNVAEVRYHLAMAYRKTGQEAKAREELKRASELEKRQGVLKTRILAALKEGT